MVHLFEFFPPQVVSYNIWPNKSALTLCTCILFYKMLQFQRIVLWGNNIQNCSNLNKKVFNNNAHSPFGPLR